MYMYSTTVRQLKNTCQLNLRYTTQEYIFGLTTWASACARYRCPRVYLSLTSAHFNPVEIQMHAFIFGIEISEVIIRL